MKQKILVTVHSQKGGVGKTLISLYLARRLAEDKSNADNPEAGLETVLIDADLTGTSFVDSLPFTARKADGTLYELSENRDLIKKRTNDNNKELFFLNDYLQCIPPAYKELFRKKDFRKYLWKAIPHNFPDKLSVIPGSGCVNDIEKTLPTIFREDVTGFLQARLSELYMALWEKQINDEENDVIVIDSPPVLHGISEVILKLHSELKEKIKLKHFCLIVCGADIQGLVSTLRYLKKFLAEKDNLLEKEWVKIILNLYPKGFLDEKKIPLDNKTKLLEFLFTEIKELLDFESLKEFLLPGNTIKIDYDNDLAKTFLDYSYINSKIDPLDKLVMQIKNEATSV
ncbi:MAG: AAA family ATPase [Spirochaetales bacterium]|nr:AAA family ATPase [Spirochaetales bacterium]